MYLYCCHTANKNGIHLFKQKAKTTTFLRAKVHQRYSSVVYDLVLSVTNIRNKSKEYQGLLNSFDP
jgi:hypothetical protein